MLEMEQILSNFDGDVTDEDKEAAVDALFARWLENGEELKVKIDNYLWLMAELEGRAEIRKKESKRLAELAKRDETNRDRLEMRLYAFLKVTGKTEFETNYHKLKRVAVGGKQRLTLLFENVMDLPKKFRTEIREWRADTEAIRAALESGDAKIAQFAKLEERGERLKIS